MNNLSASGCEIKELVLQS